MQRLGLLRLSVSDMLYLDSTLVGEAYARLRTGTGEAHVLVLGVGNIRRGDDGAGVHVIRRLRREPPIPGVRLHEAATNALRALPALNDVRALIIVDAARDLLPAGTVNYRQPGGTRDLPRGLCGTRLGVRELLRTATLLGRLPSLHLFTISIAAPTALTTVLTSATAAGVAVATCMVHGLASRLAARGIAA
jgi:hydrogenase maturation protease